MTSEQETDETEQIEATAENHKGSKTIVESDNYHTRITSTVYYDRWEIR